MPEWVSLVLTFALSLGLTLLFELIIAFVWQVRGKSFLLVILVNVLTNPAAVYLNLLLTACFPQSNVYLWQLPMELAVVLIEGACYALCAKEVRYPWLLAVIANAVSYGLGIVLSFFL